MLNLAIGHVLLVRIRTRPRASVGAAHWQGHWPRAGRGKSWPHALGAGPAAALAGTAAMDAAVVRSVVGRCQELTPAECEHFLDHGFVLVKGAFSRGLAAEVVEQSWTILRENAAIVREDPESWKAMPYVRPAGSGRRIVLGEEAPRAQRAQLDLLGGAERVQGGLGALTWSDGTVANLCKDGGRPWPAPCAEMDGWHWDGWDFYHYLDSPEQALLVVPLFSDIAPRSGGTLLATDSIGVVARFLARHP
eukprot:SAG22_NODE_6373_length_865_cov_0.821149_1_plen_248_part_10